MTLETTDLLTREIPAENLPGLVAEIEKLNKRASRLKLAPLVLSVVDRVEVPTVDKLTKVEYNRVVLTVKLTGESPKLAGWSLVARLTPAEGSDDGENFVKTVPGVDCPIEFRTVDMGRCDHCNTNRFRKDTFVVRHESEGYKVVGRNCIGDFLGHASPESLLNSAEILWSADDLVESAGEEYWGGGSGLIHDPIDRYLGTVSIWIRRFGWVPRSKSDGNATADEVWNFLHPVSAGARESNRKFAEKNSLYAEDHDKEFVAKALEWVRDLDPGSSDYLYNLRLACKAETVTYKTDGLVASLLAAYKRHVEKLVEWERRAKVEATKRRAHVGNVKERRGFPNLTVLSTRNFDGDYGVKTLVVFESDEGDLLKWWATGDKTTDFAVGESYDVTGTVKKHGEYKGTKETLLTRVAEGIDPKKFDPLTGLPKPKKTRKKKSFEPSSAPVVEIKPGDRDPKKIWKGAVPGMPGMRVESANSEKSEESVSSEPSEGTNVNVPGTSLDFSVKPAEEPKSAAKPKPPGFNSFTLEPELDHTGRANGDTAVYGHGVYERSSVLAGRPRRTLIDSFSTIEEARAAYPYAEETGCTKNFMDSGDPGPLAPSWFDPTAAGERWDSDY